MSNTRQRSRDSSPDPLSRSYNNASLTLGSSPLKARSTGHEHSPTRPLHESSPNLPRSPSPTKQTQQRTMVFSTPSKSLTSQGAAPSSPWRIKVTVEAESEESNAQSGGKSAKKPRAKTVMVPLKDGDEHRPIKRRRRSSKGADSGAEPMNIGAAEAGQTPKRNAPRARRKSLTDATGEYAGSEDREQPSIADADEGPQEQEVSSTMKGRLRSSRKSTGKSEPAAAPVKKRGPGRPPKSVGAQKLEPSSKKNTRMEREGRSSEATANRMPKKATPAKPASRTSLEGSSHKDWGPSHSDAPAPTLDGSNAADYSFEQQLTNSVRSRRISDRMPTPRHPPARSNLSAGEDKTPDNDADYYSSGSENGDADSIDIDEDGMTAQLDRSLAESEGFSMVSIESLRSQREQAEREHATEAHQDGTLREEVEIAGNHEESHSNAPDDRHPQDGLRSRPSNRLRKEAAHDTDAATPALDRVREASYPIDATTPATDQKEKANDAGPFSAFHTGTRRQLRAGLAMGELLARSEPAIGGAPRGQDTQQALSAAKHLHRAVTDHVNDGRLPTPADTAEETSSPPAQDDGARQKNEPSAGPTPERRRHYDDMSWEPSTFVAMRNGTGVGYDDMSWEPTGHTTAKAPADRDAVANAEGSHISYDELSAASANDIWLEEAETSFEDSMAGRGARDKRKRPGTETAKESTPPAKRAAKAMQEQTPDLQALFGEPDTRPTRGRIPRTWRRTSGNHFLYSDENPSPEQKRDGPRTPLFLRDLRALDEAAEEVEAEDGDQNSRPVPSIERSPSPRRGILSSPLRRRESASPAKEVHFGDDIMHEYDEAESSSHAHPASQLDGTASDDRDDLAAEESESECVGGATVHPQNTPDVRFTDTGLKGRRSSKQVSNQANPAWGPPRPQHSSERASLLQPHPDKQYPKLFDSNRMRPVATQPKVDKSLPPTPRQPTPLKRILKHRSPPTPRAAEPTRGIFSRLSSWLYPPAPSRSVERSSSIRAPIRPANAAQSSCHNAATKPDLAPQHAPVPTASLEEPVTGKPTPPTNAKPRSHTQDPKEGIRPGWNRNHYLLLDHHWRHYFLTPTAVLEEAVSTHGTTTSDDPHQAFMELLTYTRPPHASKQWAEHSDQLAVQRAKAPIDRGCKVSMSEALKVEVGTLISAPGEKPMEVSLRHCLVAQAFMDEARRKGLPLLTDGGLAPPPSPSSTSSAGTMHGPPEHENRQTPAFPRRDEKGRVIRVKEEWKAKDVLIKIYGLWVRDIEGAVREVEAKMGEKIEVVWPLVEEEEEGVVERVRRVLGRR